MSEKMAAVGDCAKLREALKHIKDRLPYMLQYMRVHWEDASAGGYFDELMLVIDAALSTPLRNCDRTECATLEMATKTWIREEFGPHCNNSKATMGDIRTFDVWLFAPATEQEGGNDGRMSD